MKLRWWHISRPNKYSQLLTVLIVLFIVAPISGVIIGDILISTLFLSITVSIIRTFEVKKRFLFLLFTLATVAFSLDLYTDLQPDFEQAHFFDVLSQIISSLFIFAALVTITRKIFSEKIISNDTIKGGIAMFMMIGIVWALLYRIVYYFDPHAFSESVETMNSTGNMFYFSFSTLTTLGYGDITPVSEFARNLTNLEAITGMLYPSILIAKLVGAYTAQDMSKDD